MTSFAQAQREGVCRLEAGLGGPWCEFRPLRSGRGQVDVGHRPGRAERVEARTVAVLQLEQLHEPGALVGGGHEGQPAAMIREHQPDLAGAEQTGHPSREHLQELHDVEVVDERVGDVHEQRRQSFGGNGGHSGLPPFCQYRTDGGHAWPLSNETLRATTSRATSPKPLSSAYA
jgi:hypothetical protein